MAHTDVDVIVGDWMSECTMSWHGAAKDEQKANGLSEEERLGLYDPSFLGTFSPALSVIQEKGIKVAVNAGASDTEKLAKEILKKIKELGLTLKVAWIAGDDVIETVKVMLAKGEKFENICFGGELKDWGFEPLAAQ
jgi:4-hydroxy-3-methylbut-2-enyl diphosphate reductase IspH